MFLLLRCVNSRRQRFPHATSSRSSRSPSPSIVPAAFSFTTTSRFSRFVPFIVEGDADESAAPLADRQFTAIDVAGEADPSLAAASIFCAASAKRDDRSRAQNGCHSPSRESSACSLYAVWGLETVHAHEYRFKPVEPSDHERSDDVELDSSLAPNRGRQQPGESGAHGRRQALAELPR